VKWRDEIIRALTQLGGEAALDEIYTKVKGNTDKEIPTTFRAVIRNALEVNSSDSENFSDKEDVFYSVHGKGKGVWGIRNFKVTEDNMDTTQDDGGFSEGRQNLKKHLCRERNHELIRVAKERHKVENNGSLPCSICKMTFSGKYGVLGDGFIEAHHIKPVSQMKDGEKTKIEDLIMVCSNCHSMLHRRKPWPTKEQIYSILFNSED